MNRLKFLLFALIVLGLWAFVLFRSASTLPARSTELAAARASAAAPLVAQTLAERRAVALAALSKAAASPALIQQLTAKNPAKPEPIGADKFGAVRTALMEALPEGSRADAVVVVSNEASSLAAKGDGEPVAEGPDFAAITGAGLQGAAQDAFEGKYYFVSVPVGAQEKPATVAVGLSQWMPDLAAVAKDLDLSGVAVVAGEKVIATGGDEKVASVAASKLKTGEAAVVSRGAVKILGPAKLPLFVDASGEAPLEVGARRAMPGTPYEVVAVASLAPALTGLADFQQLMLLGLIGLLGLALLWTAIMGPSAPKQKAKSLVLPKAPELPSRPIASPAAAAAPALASASSQPVAASEPLAMPELPPPPEANPEDFEFPNNTPSPAVATATPFDEAAPAPAAPYAPFDTAEPSAPAPAPYPFEGGEEDEGERTRAYPAPPGAADPFASVGGMSPDQLPPAEGEGDFNPEATRVAVVPNELLQQAKKTEEPAAFMSPGRASAQAAVTKPHPQLGGNPDEAHWQEVYRDFVATRERCGEPADGLTYEKFRVKLQKNREQLVQKYNCRTVRFQVYVKEGKAALKATPVKE